jgi:hypothetical protein
MDEIRDSSCAEANHSDQKNRIQLLQDFVSACNEPSSGSEKRQDNPVVQDLGSEQNDGFADVNAVQDCSSGARFDSFLLVSSHQGLKGAWNKGSRNHSETHRRPFSTSPPRSRSVIFRRETLSSNEHAVYKNQVARSLNGGSAVWL